MAKNIYLSNEDLLNEVHKCQDNDNIMSEKLGEMFLLLVNKYATKSNWAGYTYNDDMKSCALLSLSNAWWKFDSTKYSNAFAYYTQMIFFAFLQLHNKETKKRELRDLLLIESGMLPSFSYQEKTHSSDKLDNEEEAAEVKHYSKEAIDEINKLNEVGTDDLKTYTSEELDKVLGI